MRYQLNVNRTLQLASANVGICYRYHSVILSRIILVCLVLKKALTVIGKFGTPFNFF
jgi:hypothetical protein